MPKISRTNAISLLIAKKGTGKTALATALAITQPKKVFWITPLKTELYFFKNDTWGLQNADFNDTKQICYIFADSYQNLQTNLQSLQEKIRENNEQNGAIGALIVIDEIDFYLKRNTIDEIYKIINYGRHLNIDFLAIARQIQTTPTTLRTNIDNFIIGESWNLTNDRKFYADFLTDDELKIVENLGKFEFFKKNIHKKCEILTINQKVYDIMEQFKC